MTDQNSFESATSLRKSLRIKTNSRREGAGFWFSETSKAWWLPDTKKIGSISAVNQVISKRMVKKQQMRWTESGAHNLLQIRTKVLNNQLRETFIRWYPGM